MVPFLLASGTMAPTQVEKSGPNLMFADKLLEEINEITIKDDKVEKAATFFLKFVFCIYLVYVYIINTSI